MLEAEDQNTGLKNADFSFGLPEKLLTVSNTTNISAKQHAFYFYAQDDWRATSRLTLNLGLRYELHSTGASARRAIHHVIPGLSTA